MKMVSPVDLQKAYQDVFTSPAGHILMADLIRQFGFTTRSTRVPGDRQASDMNEGARLTLVYIERVLHTDPTTTQAEEADYDGSGHRADDDDDDTSPSGD